MNKGYILKKTILYIFLACNVFALDLGSVIQTASSSDVKNVLQNVANSNSNGLLSSFKNDLFSLGGQSLQSILNLTSGVMPTGFVDMCYQYSPVPISPLKFNLNICSIFNNVSSNPCSLAPDLSALGYKKINTDVSSDYVSSLKNYCNNIFGTNQIQKQTLKNVVLNSSSFDNGIVMLPKTTEIQSTNDQKVSEILKGISSGSDLRSKSAATALNSTNYESAQFYKKAIAKTVLSGNNNLDIGSLEQVLPNVKYQSIQEYKQDTKSFSSQLAIALQEIDFRPKLESAEAEMTKVEDDTTDRAEALKQKQAIAAQFLKEYKSVLDKNKPFLMNVWNDLRKRKYKIANPTKSFINSLPNDQRAANVYKIEVQQEDDAMFQAKIDDDFRIRLYNAKKMLEELIIVTAKFDEAAAINRINALLSM